MTASLPPAATLGALIAIVLIIDFLVRRLYLAKRPAPPGPRARPLIGHILDMPKQSPWEKYHKWCKDFNTDIIELNVLGTPIVILDTLQAVNDLLDKRSGIYSSRPRMPMVTELMGWDFNLGTMPYGSRWRAHRRIFAQSFHAGSASLYEPHGLRASRRLLLNLLQEPEKFMDHFRYFAGSTILSVAYGIDTAPKNDRFIRLSEEAIQPVLQAVVPGTYLVDTFPILKHIPDWMPLAGFKKIAKESRALSAEMVAVPFAVTQANMLSGKYSPSFVSTRLQDMDKLQDAAEQEELIKNAAATMYSSGSDNIISTLAGFVLALLENPDAQTKAQNEIDSVLLGKIPTFDDKASLPYVTALTMEVFRWCISSPLGGPHVLEIDDEYKGYVLQAGSIVFANIWAIFHDEVAYPDPFVFKPERFLKDGKLDPVNEITAVFGFGRRICPGRYMSFSLLWITISSILATCNISKAVDKDGNVIEPTIRYITSSSCLPAPFKCSIKPRTSEIEHAIVEAYGKDYDVSG